MDPGIAPFADDAAPGPTHDEDASNDTAVDAPNDTVAVDAPNDTAADVVDGAANDATDGTGTMAPGEAPSDAGTLSDLGASREGGPSTDAGHDPAPEDAGSARDGGIDSVPPGTNCEAMVGGDPSCAGQTPRFYVCRFYDGVSGELVPFAPPEGCVLSGLGDTVEFHCCPGSGSSP